MGGGHYILYQQWMQLGDNTGNGLLILYILMKYKHKIFSKQQRELIYPKLQIYNIHKNIGFITL